MADLVWKQFFEDRGAYRADCRFCGQSIDVRGGRPLKHLSAAHPDAIAATAQPTAPAQGLPATPGATSAVQQDGSREELLKGLWADSRDRGLSATERARARELIAKVEGYAEDKEPDSEDLRLRHLERAKAALDAQGGSEAEIMRLLSDQVNGRAAREWLRDLITKAEAVRS